MTSKNGIEFINREEQLSFLSDCIKTSDNLSALIFIRAPSGFGKSSLTDQFQDIYASQEYKFCIVDSYVGTESGTNQLYNGFFLQCCAEELNTLSKDGFIKWSDFRSYAGRLRWKTAVSDGPKDIFSELPSLKTMYKIAYEYASRILGFGQFSAEQLLKSDQAIAVSLSCDYAIDVLTNNPVILIIREAQHIDLESLRLLLRLSEAGNNSHIIFEYTTEKGEFHPEHHKPILNTAARRNDISILDLLKLDLEHVQHLIRGHIASDFTLHSDAYFSWNGNLRSIVELKFRVGIGQKIAKIGTVSGVLSNFNKELSEHISDLTSLELLILSILFAHSEPLEEWTLSKIVFAINKHTPSKHLERSMEHLIGTHGFICRTKRGYRISDESTATIVETNENAKPLIAIAEKYLRDHYHKLIEERDYLAVGMSIAVRQLFRLGAKTKDANCLLQATTVLSQDVKKASDQSIYIEAITYAIDQNHEVFDADQDELLIWAASLAYGVCDWKRVYALIANSHKQDLFSLAMQACALQEIGKHDEALMLTKNIPNVSSHLNAQLTASLIEALIAGCRGNREYARELLDTMIANPIYQNSPLLGYAYRFFEIVDGFIESIDKLKRSVEWFDKFGFVKSKAYSQLSAAIYMARAGNISEAQLYISEAHPALIEEVRDQHLILNNGVVVDLLSKEPDYETCISLLSTALKSARDDFSEITILSNLAIAHTGMENIEEAVECAERSIIILESHDFVDRDIYWAVCFNAAVVFEKLGDSRRQHELLGYPSMMECPKPVNHSYWANRYGHTDLIEPQYEYLLSCSMHPLYLSHWLIDLEGLEWLMKEQT